MGTETTSFGTTRRESHDSARFYGRGLMVVTETEDTRVSPSPVQDEIFHESAVSLHQLVDRSVALMITSPPYHVGKEYDSDVAFGEYLDMLTEVFRETYRVLEPGGRAVVNVANLGRKPYVPLSHLVTQRMLDLGFFMRGEIIWRKGRGANGNCAWGSWRSPSNPVIRDVHEYCLVFSKGRFARVRRGTSTISPEDFMAATLSVWDIPSESASRVKHPAPFPVELPRRFIQLYTYAGELVLDPFLGSGTTAVAAVQEGRRFVGYEVEADYIETAWSRIEAARRTYR